MQRLKNKSVLNLARGQRREVNTKGVSFLMHVVNLSQEINGKWL